MKDDNLPLNEKYKAILQSEQQAAAVLDISSLPEKNDQGAVDTSAIDQQWLTLTQDWQAQPFEKTDISALLSQTKRRTWWAKGCFILNILATFLSLVGFIYGVVNGQLGQPINSFLGLGGLMSVFFVCYEFKIRRESWSKINNSPEQAIDNALAGYQSSLKYMLLTKWSCVPFAVLANWLVYSVAQQSGRLKLTELVFINLVLVSTFVVAEVLYRKRKKEYQQLRAKTENL
ncbi:hypothetical protein tinsulaeT_25990 [Thalassotalea insulae]|uniref:Uncharacterized protein n=1 Tax=Thalassotalea insulae TaxID=2056778 RepID=A0ABQ6GUC0_9GAMM|nr:hypothetical protein [Thalassotalea insulae]GLX79259.1 hypothetical protein tinsulaeT_25990 [Thalassotalea insulae]